MVLRIAGEQPTVGRHDVERREVVAREAVAPPEDADPAAERSLPWVRRYVDAGATRLVLHAGIKSPDELHLLRDQLNRYQDEVGSQF